MRLGTVGVLAVAVAMASGFGCGSESGAARGQSGAEAPHPDVQKASVEELIHIAAEDGEDGFRAIRGLRDIGDARAVPTLGDLMAKYMETGNAKAYVAAQALFCIGTEGAHTILRKHLSDSGYSVGYAIKMALRGDMAPEKRDAFIRQYHLANTVQDLKAVLKVAPVEEDGAQCFRFTLTLTNVSDHPLAVEEPICYPAELLLAEDAEGYFHRGLETVAYYSFSRYDELRPGGEMNVTFEMRPEWKDAKHAPTQWGTPDTGQALFLVSHDYDLHLGKPGTFKVRAIIHKEKTATARNAGEYALLPNLWYGTVVSEPVTIDVRPPESLPVANLGRLSSPHVTKVNAQEDVLAKRRKECLDLVRQYVAWTPPPGAANATNPYRAKILAAGPGMAPLIYWEYRFVDRQPLPPPLIRILSEIGAVVPFDMLVEEYQLRPAEQTAVSVGACLSAFQVDLLRKRFPAADDAKLRGLLQAIYGPATYDDAGTLYNFTRWRLDGAPEAVGLRTFTFNVTADSTAAALYVQPGPAFSIWRQEGGIPEEILNVDDRSGNVFALGSFLASSLDLAENFDAGETLNVGSVVVIDSKASEQLVLCRKSYDSSAAGIISYKPGMLLGAGLGSEPAGKPASAGKASLALAGRTPCKVDASYGAIAVGDLLTTSPTPGHAMKADADKIVPGCIIGKALEPLEAGKGVIKVMVTLQ